MKTLRLFGLTLGICATALPLRSQSRLEATRDVLDQWVQTRQITSQAKSDWRLEQSILTDTQALLRGELERLQAALAALQGSASAADQDRAQLAAKKEAMTAATAVIAARIGTLEAQLQTILPSLPKPLLEGIKPLIRRLPQDPANTRLSLGERVQNIVGILSQADKFNRTITQTSEARTLDNGKVIEVRTLYWGLAMAYYVDATGDYAGIGLPDKEGWQWPQLAGAGPQIKQLLDVYAGTEAIQFVELPARIH
jgi:hypothetical protein